MAENRGANATPVGGSVAGEELQFIECASDGLVNARFRELAAVESKATPNGEDWTRMLGFTGFEHGER